MNLSRSLGLGVLVAASHLVLWNGPVSAQNISVQQPSVGIMSGATTLSVPDRGQSMISGLGARAASQSVYGPVRNNTNYGSSTSGGTMSARVFIHDFDAMDREVLSAAKKRSSDDKNTPDDRRAAHAFRQLRDPLDDIPATSSKRGTVRTGAVASKGESEGPSADELYRKGVAAESAGKTGVAKIFFRVARDKGSSAATEALARLEPVTSQAPSRTSSRGAKPAR